MCIEAINSYRSSAVDLKHHCIAVARRTASVFEREHINGGLSWKEFRNRLKSTAQSVRFTINGPNLRSFPALWRSETGQTARRQTSSLGGRDRRKRKRMDRQNHRPCSGSSDCLAVRCGGVHFGCCEFSKHKPGPYPRHARACL